MVIMKDLFQQFNYGFKLSSLINSDNTSNYFNVNEVNILHKNIKVNWEWI